MVIYKLSMVPIHVYYVTITILFVSVCRYCQEAEAPKVSLCEHCCNLMLSVKSLKYHQY